MISARLRLPALLMLMSGATFALGCFAVHSGSATSSHAITPSPSTLPTSAVDAQPVYFAQTPEEAKSYVGDAACAPCHPDISRKYDVTGHARSLHLVRVATDGRFFGNGHPVRDTKTDTTYRTAVRDGQCILVNDVQGEKEGLPAQIAIGSGHNGVTYLGQDRDKQWVIQRLSYYTQTKGWDFTPGQEPDIASLADPNGQTLGLKQVSACLSCHAVSVQRTSDELDVRHSRFGVGCESCHGPGRAHVDSLRGPDAGTTRPFVPMEDLKKAAATRIMQLCGGCHSAFADSHSGSPQTGESVSRFAATALMQSKCLRNSGTLSCVTCHDPHTNAATNTASYEAACLRCHSSPSTSQQPAASPLAPRLCKVNPRSGCIGCHMPTQTNASFPHTLFHNHWIKIWKGDRAEKR